MQPPYCTVWVVKKRLQYIPLVPIQVLIIAWLHPSKFFSALQSFCCCLSVVLLSCDSRSTLTRRDRTKKFGRAVVVFRVDKPLCLHLYPIYRYIWNTTTTLKAGTFTFTYPRSQKDTIINLHKERSVPAHQLFRHINLLPKCSSLKLL